MQPSVTYDSVNNYESVGIPFSKNTFKVVDPDNWDEFRYGVEDEICIIGPTIMIGYYNNQDATDDLIKTHKDGKRWLHTGDLGHIDENGIIYVTGRIKRIIMTKGTDGQVTKLFPDRIEKTVCIHKSVDQCCVIGVPDEQRINYPKAFVVLKTGETASEEKKRELINHCKELIPEYMIPHQIEFIDELPRTLRGKVDYHALEQMEAEG